MKSSNNHSDNSIHLYRESPWRSEWIFYYLITNYNESDPMQVKAFEQISLIKQRNLFISNIQYDVPYIAEKG